jgi:hydroxymethylbilane synthase
MTQTNMVAEALRGLYPELEIEILPRKTKGDDPGRAPMGGMGIKGLFTKEIEEALLSKEADLAVHSAKDLPALLPEGLTLGAVPRRETPFDAFICLSDGGITDLPPDAIVGTSSLRRKAQLLALRNDLRIRPIRGNVDTRIQRVAIGDYDATILAASGLRRLKGENYPIRPIAPEELLPAPGQGILALEHREEDKWIHDLLSPLNHIASELALAAERSFMLSLGAGCQTPAAAWARKNGDDLVMDSLVAETDGSLVIRAGDKVGCLKDLDCAREMGHRLAMELLYKGGEAIIKKALKETY